MSFQENGLATRLSTGSKSVPLAQGAVAFEGVDQGAPRRRKSFCSHKFAV
jgi:hypothetical protein